MQHLRNYRIVDMRKIRLFLPVDFSILSFTIHWISCFLFILQFRCCRIGRSMVKRVRRANKYFLCLKCFSSFISPTFFFCHRSDRKTWTNRTNLKWQKISFNSREWKNIAWPTKPNKKGKEDGKKKDIVVWIESEWKSRWKHYSFPCDFSGPITVFSRSLFCSPKRVLSSIFSAIFLIYSEKLLLICAFFVLPVGSTVSSSEHEKKLTRKTNGFFCRMKWKKLHLNLLQSMIVRLLHRLQCANQHRPYSDNRFEI